MRSQYHYCIIPGNGKCTSLFSIFFLNREEFLAISLSKQGLPFFSRASSSYLPISLMSAFLKTLKVHTFTKKRESCNESPKTTCGVSNDQYFASLGSSATFLSLFPVIF